MLFIDSNQYLDFYRLPGLKRLLKPLDKVSDRVFVTSQIADEVTKNKVAVARIFFDKHFKELGEEFRAIGKGLPDQLFSDTVMSELQLKLKEIKTSVQETNKVADKAVDDLLVQIGKSEDDVSRFLAGIFCRAEDANQSELDRARLRKEQGRAPGKPDNPLGDQITWEQLLTRAENCRQVWIISKDGDYCQKYKEAVVLNAALYHDLTHKRQDIVVNCFTEMEKGLRAFAEANEIQNAGLPTRTEAEQINKEQEALQLRDRMDSDDDVRHMMTVQEIYRHRRKFGAALIGQSDSEK